MDLIDLQGIWAEEADAEHNAAVADQNDRLWGVKKVSATGLPERETKMKHWKLFLSHLITCILFTMFGIFVAVLVIFPESEIVRNMDTAWGLLK